MQNLKNKISLHKSRTDERENRLYGFFLQFYICILLLTSFLRLLLLRIVIRAPSMITEHVSTTADQDRDRGCS